MSEQPQDPGRWQASDGASQPPEGRPPSVAPPATGAPSAAEAVPVTRVASSMPDLLTTEAPPATSPVADLPAAVEVAPVSDMAGPKVPPIPVPELPKRPTWSGESDRRPEAGPMYPDLFNQALAGSSLANVVTVNYADGEPRPGLDVPMTSGLPVDAEGDQVLVSASARMPAQVGAFTGASAKKRWRIHR